MCGLFYTIIPFAFDTFGIIPKLYKTFHELSIVLSFFVVFFKNYKSTIVSRHTSHKLSILHAALAGLVEGSTVASMPVRGS